MKGLNTNVLLNSIDWLHFRKLRRGECKTVESFGWTELPELADLRAEKSAKRLSSKGLHSEGM